MGSRFRVVLALVFAGTCSEVSAHDFGRFELNESHQIVFEQNIPGFENVANLDQLPGSGFTIVALPMKIAGGSGGPVRIVAFVFSR